MARKLSKREKLLIPIMMLFFAAGGSLMGMAEETLAYIPLLIPLALALGFDTLTGTAMVLLGASAGFTTAVMNPFTVTDKQMLVALDRHGLRPLSLGKIGDSIIAASETCALEAVDAKFWRDVEPGEWLLIDKKGIQTGRFAEKN